MKRYRILAEGCMQLDSSPSFCNFKKSQQTSMEVMFSCEAAFQSERDIRSLVNKTRDLYGYTI